MKSKQPFFARYLEGQTLKVQTGLRAGAPYVTLKYPSDKDEANSVTLKYPSDDDEGFDPGVRG